MPSTLTKALIAFVPVTALLVYSVIEFTKRRTAPVLVQVLGTTCLLVVVLTHVAEGLRLFPSMRFGEPDSVGHYLDLASAISSVVFLAGAVILRVWPRRNRMTT